MANMITAVRIVCALGMIFCPAFSVRFYALYIVGGVSDILDGIAARLLGTETKLGAQLDTIADIAFTAAVLLKMMRAIDIPVWLIIWIGGIAVIRCVNIISGFVIYKRFVSEHTVMNKACGALLFAIPICVGQLPQQTVEALILLSCGVSTFASVQEGYYIRTGKEIG